MTACLDSSVLVDVLRGSTFARTYLEGLERVPIASETVRVEVIRGLRSGERRGAERLFATLDWVAVDETIARRAGELGRRFRASHPGIGAVDLVVAATAEQANATLATRNVKHFPMFRDLRPPY